MTIPTTETRHKNPKYSAGPIEIAKGTDARKLQGASGILGFLWYSAQITAVRNGRPMKSQALEPDEATIRTNASLATAAVIKHRAWFQLGTVKVPGSKAATALPD
jgi:hypothetical protein